MWAELATNSMIVVEEIDDAIDAIEDQVVGNPTPSTLQEIFTMKRALLRLRRITRGITRGIIRDIIPGITRDIIPGIIPGIIGPQRDG